MLMLLWQISTTHRETGKDTEYFPLQHHLHKLAQNVVRNYCHEQKVWWHLWWEWPQLLTAPDEASTLHPTRGDALQVWGNSSSTLQGSSGVQPVLGTSSESPGKAHSHPCTQELVCSKKNSSGISAVSTGGSEGLHLTLLLVKNFFIFYFNEICLCAKHFAERVCGFEEWERAVNRSKSFSNYQQSARDVNSSL